MVGREASINLTAFTLWTPHLPGARIWIRRGCSHRPPILIHLNRRVRLGRISPCSLAGRTDERALLRLTEALLTEALLGLRLTEALLTEALLHRTLLTEALLHRTLLTEALLRLHQALLTEALLTEALLNSFKYIVGAEGRQ
jgi:hypothetical protein